MREQASRELAGLGEAVEPQLREALKGQPSAEVRRRVEGLLEKLSGQTAPPEVLRAWRGVEVLERADTPDARAALEALAKGPREARLTQDAKASLQRLARRKAVP